VNLFLTEMQPRHPGRPLPDRQRKKGKSQPVKKENKNCWRKFTEHIEKISCRLTKESFPHD
jgi:hypothetical protein